MESVRRGNLKPGFHVELIH